MPLTNKQYDTIMRNMTAANIRITGFNVPGSIRSTTDPQDP